MAQATTINNGVQTGQLHHTLPKAHLPKSSKTVNFGSNLRFSPKFMSLTNKRVGGQSSIVPRIQASVAAAAEKPSSVPEIVLQPIKEISGTVQLPGSKSLSNRILLLAALSEVFISQLVKLFNLYLTLEFILHTP